MELYIPRVWARERLGLDSILLGPAQSYRQLVFVLKMRVGSTCVLVFGKQSADLFECGNGFVAVFSFFLRVSDLQHCGGGFALIAPSNLVVEGDCFTT